MLYILESCLRFFVGLCMREFRDIVAVWLLYRCIATGFALIQRAAKNFLPVRAYRDKFTDNLLM